MPRIAEFVKLPDGRLAVALDPFPDCDAGSVTLWTGPEREREILAHVRAEREACAEIAETMGGDFIECDANGDGYREARASIAKAIRAQL